MKWKQHYDTPFTLFHLSEDNHDGETFIPRPMNKECVIEGENWQAKRICVSKTIDGAVSALMDSVSMAYGIKLYVHEIANINELFKKDKVYKPTTKQVPDCETTDEYWLKDKAILKCIGAIEVGHITDHPLYYMWNGVETRMDRFMWKWIEKG